ncbi:uncharacterized protein BO97DRAFT_433270 [Aspergillus homomorphus CBS 101889]|uniref:Protein kinase domain-containing protein n=1 Tax=Aspergillus homomorphus (strain CBS 101889) TaxID=1450537 RepID=A0A395I2K0_ASPHC|nr:hypothetical protein BO97DRAFT_433270 [Aspergillus homomorphus CBS 101889]RAL14167.1 hypothetical protein BO97DRAFT_433270 [Aspergillus homomorphus CBS 101889]
MASHNVPWQLREFFFGRFDKMSRITVVCNGNCFQIQLSPSNFCQSPLALETYTHFMDAVCDDEDYRLSYAAEEDLHHWALTPFLPMFAQTTPTPPNQQPLTLRDYLSPEIYRYSLYAVNERLEPRLDYDVPTQPCVAGVDPGDITLHHTWRQFVPESIELCVSDHDEGLSQLPRKVLADGTVCFFKPVDYDDKRAAIREMGVYKEMKAQGISDEAHAPHFIGVVCEEQNARIIGLLLSWVDCGNRTLECALRPDTPLTLRTKWDQQVTTALACLHDAGIVWGDVKAANVLIDNNENAWVVDKDQMETIQGDTAGLVKIKELIHATR